MKSFLNKVKRRPGNGSVLEADSLQIKIDFTVGF